MVTDDRDRRRLRLPGIRGSPTACRLPDGLSATPSTGSIGVDGVADRFWPRAAANVGPRRYGAGMAKSTTGYRCTECGWQATKWVGRCGECQTWGTVEEAALPRLVRAGIRAAGYGGGSGGAGRLGGGPVSTAAMPIGQVDASEATARPTGLDELDRVLGGGLVPGAVLLLAGEPGVGKSTLLLEAGALVAGSGPVLYITGEESAAQVRLRADRIGAAHENLYLAAETDLDAIITHVEAVQPRLLIIDSVQTIAAGGVDGVPGGVTQVREVAAALTAVAKERAMSTILVGHVTKDGSVAGPRTLEHLVDVVLHFEGDRHSRLRMVRAVKNRYGPTDEVGCFDLGEYGMIGLADPSGLFLSRHREPVPGTCVTVTLEGRRPLLAEVQALVGISVLDQPRRVTSGLDASRVGMVLAVLQRRADVKVGKSDVYAATVGGVRLTEPSVDLAVALALASSVADLSIPQGVIVVGEVGLAGEVRNVAGVPRRVAEAERMGFKRAIVPAGSSAGSGSVSGGGSAADSAMEVVEVEDVRDAMKAAFRGLFVKLERADRAGLADRHGDRVESPPGAGRQRAAAAGWARGPAVPRHRQHLRHAEHEPYPRRGRGLARGRIPHHAAVLCHDDMHRARSVAERAGGGRCRDGVHAEAGQLALSVAGLAGEQAEHDVARRAARPAHRVGRGT
jgi:DNA repair protein RadA/Sms